MPNDFKYDVFLSHRSKDKPVCGSWRTDRNKINSACFATRWMEMRDWLKRASDNGKKPVKQIVFDGERFDVMSVLRWREKALR